MSEQSMLRLPVQANPTRPDRVASAPYNFVPLPETVVPAVRSPDDLPSHDVYGSADRDETRGDTYSRTGYVDAELIVLSPVYVRCGLTREQFVQQERQDKPYPAQQEEGQQAKKPADFRDQVKNRPQFFYTSDETQPVIPGSSLRGMLRGVLEIASYSKVAFVTDKRLFFRSVDNTSLGLAYRDRMVGRMRFGNKVEGGFLRREETRATVGIIQPCEVLRIPRSLITARIGNGTLPSRANEMPDWDQQHTAVWVKRPLKGVVVTEVQRRQRTEERPLSSGWLPGKLVITGAAPGKKKEFVFLIPSAHPGETERSFIPIERSQGESEQVDLIDQFHDDDQLTQWQKRAFPRNQPTKVCREQDGLLRTLPGDLDDPGDPIFYLREDKGDGKMHLSFFGRAQMFRLPYLHTPRDLVPTELRERDRDAQPTQVYADCIDYAEALFGYVRDRWSAPEGAKQGDKARGYASRVSISDATLVPGQKDVLAAAPMVPPILGTPKPTAFQHYLVQQQSVRDRLAHFDSPDTKIRGHKRYWHQGPRTFDNVALTGQSLQQVKHDSTQHTRFQPVKAGTRFRFRVYFDNLSEAELGALCWTLQPLGPAGTAYAHSLGMGKSLGMGAVQVRATLHLTDRVRRYERLFMDDKGAGWETGEGGTPVALSDHAILVEHTRAFERHILDHLGLSRDTASHLYEVRRIAVLLRLMEWPGIVAREPTGENPTNRQGNVRSMRLDLPYVTDPRDRNEFRSRPVLPDPSAFDRPLSGILEPRSPGPNGHKSTGTKSSTRGDEGRQSREAGNKAAQASLESFRPIGSGAVEGVMAHEVERLQQRAVQQTSAPHLRRGDVLEADVLHTNKDRGTIRVRLRTHGHEEMLLKNILPYLLDGSGLAPGSTITCKVEEVDQKSGRVLRVSWKR